MDLAGREISVSVRERVVSISTTYQLCHEQNFLEVDLRRLYVAHSRSVEI